MAEYILDRQKVQKADGTLINPATEAKQDDIITAIQAIPGGGGVQYTEGDIDATIIGTALMWEDAGDTLVPVSVTKPLPVSASIDTTGLATSTKQDTIIGHLDGVESLLTTIEANQLADGHNVTIDNVSVPVTGTFWQATQPVSATDLDIRNLSSATDSITTVPSGTQAISEAPSAISATTADATASGDNTIVSITNTPRLYYISLSANGANSADVTAIVKLGATSKYKVSLKAGAIWARNVGAGRNYITGASGEDIIVNLSAAQTVHVSVEYADA